ncbi:uncharacterized protein LOC114516707 [Dendronephthya gigantea]|uniref:uncharacterized protein LOC114516707 n=1 Tax=Dendronephthya gigantea TaxID=151771 RepID=UPI00106B5BEC|nr:uncharacterized protein LOC114516707 [Dendronephthya gigantea]
MDDVEVLKAKLLRSEAENQKLRQQLQSLILLVKKAWTGDHSAAIDVALIVGVSPPTLEVSSLTDEIVAVPKSQCVNNWLRLTVGLINKQFKESRTTAMAEQLLHLRDREAFIDEQMESKVHNSEPKFGDIEQRTRVLHELVESEDIKRNELKLKLGRPCLEGPNRLISSKPKSRVSSAKQTRCVKLANTSKVDQCLVIQSRNAGVSKEQQPSATKNRPMPEEKHKPRAKSAGSARRPFSAPHRAASGGTSRQRPRSGIKRNNQGQGRIDDKLNKTESDIAMTVQLLQQRLGIDERGMV